MSKRKMIGAQSALTLLTLAVSHPHAATRPALDAGMVSRAQEAADKPLAKMTQEEKLAYIGASLGPALINDSVAWRVGQRQALRGQ